MNREELSRLLDAVACGAVKPDVAADQLVAGPFRRTELEFATLDHHRSLRHRMGEVVYGEGKTAEQCVAIVERLAATGTPVLVTRLDAERSAALLHHFPEGRENRTARTFIANPPAVRGSASGEPFVAIIAAGTSDLPVAEEAAEVCLASETAFERICDVGVAGLHRLLHRIPEIQKASALVVVAGMEGALPSVVAGLVGRPLFAVPTSVGYGASFGGLAALLAMLNSCAPGVTVVNIDNGFSAAYAACNVVHLVREARLDGARRESL